MAVLERRLEVEVILFLKNPDFFHFFTLSLEISVKNKAPPRQILQDCVTSLGNSMAKNHQGPLANRKSHITFSCSPLEILLAISLIPL